MKLLTSQENGVAVAYIFDCPGCKCSHEVYVRPHISPNGASWDFNGNTEKPTFKPSILSKVSRPDGTKTMVCHSFVTDGKIQYLPDCTHELTGQTIEMPDVD
jgi:hypothetical protein